GTDRHGGDSLRHRRARVDTGPRCLVQHGRWRPRVRHRRRPGRARRLGRPPRRVGVAGGSADGLGRRRRCTGRRADACRGRQGAARAMTVYLVGAGSGDPGLLTARALELIAEADVIVYDRLIPETALDGARPGAQLIYAGKEGGGPSMPQAEIERLILDHGASGKHVVRLKGGDPFVFGRGGEEAEALVAAGIPFEVVPAVTAGVAAAA